ncbi:predicted protein [Naegleria gruberi]|uniref:Predicted protein n=1 Tax=Naegleria gruberi TaxID=5762 RepID=D2V6X4_NAEGR|nr:uncharacterized protein NAEGRDRAFT_64589 [Naegleria gruberi]EFC47522.1 predicted protein [Naegleria gruberi]|eukprot:XP_002680266.1 predicted protein [Naegleria gruberi strain NEG-M]
MFRNSHQETSNFASDESEEKVEDTNDESLVKRYENELVHITGTENVYGFSSSTSAERVSNSELMVLGKAVTEGIQRLNIQEETEDGPSSVISDNRIVSEPSLSLETLVETMQQLEDSQRTNSQPNQTQPLTSKFIPKVDHIPHNDPQDLNLLSDAFGYSSAYYCFGSNEENFLSLDYSALATSGDSYNGEVISKVMRKSFTNQSVVLNESQQARSGLGLVDTNQNVDTSPFKVRCLGGNEVVEHIRIGAYNLGVITRNLSNNFSNGNSKTNCYISGSNERGQFGRPKSFKGSNGLIKIDHFDKNNLTLKDIAFGSYFTLFLTECGKVFSCGENENGQLGTNSISNQYEIKQMRVIHPETKLEEFVTDIETGAFHTLAKTLSGNIYSCGYNCWGQCAISEIDGDVMVPTLIDKFGKDKIEIERVICIEHNTFFITKANPYSEIYGCGFSKKGQLGKDFGEAVRNPVKLDFFTGKDLSVKSVNGGWGHVCIVTNGGQVFSQGLNDYGQLGLGDLESRKSPTLVPFFDHLYKNCKLDKIEQVRCGSYHSLFLTRSGKLFGCGYNEMGSIALGNEHSWISTPTLIVQFPNCLIGEPFYELEVKTWCYTTCILVKKRFKRIENMFGRLRNLLANEEFNFGDVKIISLN